jgi:hypothetical protein
MSSARIHTPHPLNPENFSFARTLINDAALLKTCPALSDEKQKFALP